MTRAGTGTRTSIGEPAPIAPARLPALAEEVAFAARALAQAHPLSVAAATYRAVMIERERRDQSIREVADWAASAFLVGYCVRRVEESAIGRRCSAGAVPRDASTPGIDVAAVSSIAQRLGDGEALGLLDDSVVIDVLDRVIASEIDKRNEHVREQLDGAQWTEFEKYVAWWVLHGWATRVVECPFERLVTESPVAGEGVECES